MAFLSFLRQQMKRRFLASLPSRSRPTFRPRLELLEDRVVLSSLVVGDFNGDQRPDMAVINDNGLTVLLNQGNGSFQAIPMPGLADVGQGPASLVAGDFNGDGLLDLAVATPAADRPGGGCITVLLGQGNGSFQQAFHLDIHGTPSALVAGDFNGDGIPDLAVATIAGDRPGGGCIIALLGQGDGSFQQAFDIDVHGRPIALVSGDFNQDGIPDLAVATVEDRPGGGCITVLLGLGAQGNGGFQEAFDIPTDGQPSSLLAGDFNGDGVPDLAVGTVEDRPGGGCVTVLLGLGAQGNGGFQQAFHFEMAGIPAALVAGDFNGDGKLDLAVAADRPGGGCIDVLLGQGDGTFQQAFDLHVQGRPTALVAGDFNGDGNLDLVDASNGGVTILFGNGDGSLASGPTLKLPDAANDS
jgi:hypothetical protein